jgi:peptidoglycan/xylan/chitin deacetylase (PgdA/CDA1 family)
MTKNEDKQLERSMSTVFTCSIDDGHPSDMRAAELLDKHGLGATFFIPVHNREDTHMLTPAQVRQLGKRFEIGSHTYSHCYLNYVDVREAYFQIAESKKRLEEMVGRPVTGFCYPGGRYTGRDIELVRACGYRYARTTANLCFDAGTDPYRMPTTIQFFPHTRDVYVRNFITASHWLHRQTALWTALREAHWLHRLYAMFDQACEGNRVFHLWWHSRQIDELGAWSELEAFLAYAAQRVDAANRLSNAQLAGRAYHGGLVTVPGF